MRRNEKTPIGLAAGSGRVNVHSYEEFEMNLNANEIQKQEDHASKGRRGFMKVFSAAIGAGIAAAAPAQALDTSVFVTPAPYDHVKMRAEYDHAMLARLCQTVGMLQAWYHENKGGMRLEAGLAMDLEDLMFESSEAARAVAKGRNLEANWKYVPKHGLNAQKRQLLASFDRIKDEAQQMIVRTAAEFERTLPRQRPALSLVAGGAA